MDTSADILAIMKKKPMKYGIALGSTINKLSKDDLTPISKKTYVWLVNHGKNGYTAISCGQLGRGRKCAFSHFSTRWLCTNRPTDRWTKPLIELRVRN